MKIYTKVWSPRINFYSDATDLGKKEIGYRSGGANTRGFEQGDEPLNITHEPEVVEDMNRFGPRSAELILGFAR